ncbi:hypothetical protein Milano_003 [Agrobacterium phage Milano]|nr:hypothetical protein Milano_003 [Agrobacterium phage Milano]
MVKTLQRRPYSGTTIAPATQLKVKLSPTGKFLWVSPFNGSSRTRKIWNGTEYVNAPGAAVEIAEYFVGWTADETYQVVVGRATGGTTRLYLRSVDPAGVLVALSSPATTVMSDTNAIRGLERITGDTFIAYGQSAICVFRIDRGTNTIVILNDSIFPDNPVRGIAGNGNDNIIVVHSGASGSVGFQTYSVNLSTGVLSPLGTKIIKAGNRINGFDYRDGKILSHSFYTISDVMFLQRDGGNALQPVPGFDATVLQSNMTSASAQTTASFIHLGFDGTEITYLDQAAPAKFWSADVTTLQKSLPFVPPTDLPSGSTNGRQYGEDISRAFVSYTDDGKTMAVTFWVAAALQGVYVYTEYEDVTTAFLADVLLPTAFIDAVAVESAQLLADVKLPSATVDLAKNGTAQLVADVKLPSAFMVTNNTLPAELVADIAVPDAFIRQRATKRNGIMVVQTL